MPISTIDSTGLANPITTVTANTLTSGSATALTLQSAGTTAATINTSGIITQPLKPAFMATGTGGNVTVAIGSYFPFNALVSSFVGSTRNAGFSTSTYTYTAPVAGLYQFYAQFYTQNMSSVYSISWWKNGVQQVWGDAALLTYLGSIGSAANIILNGSIIIELAAGDVVGLQPRTGSASVPVYMGHSMFYGVLIG